MKGVGVVSSKIKASKEKRTAQSQRCDIMINHANTFVKNIWVKK